MGARRVDLLVAGSTCADRRSSSPRPMYCAHRHAGSADLAALGHVALRGRPLSAHVGHLPDSGRSEMYLRLFASRNWCPAGPHSALRAEPVTAPDRHRGARSNPGTDGPRFIARAQCRFVGVVSDRVRFAASWRHEQAAVTARRLGARSASGGFCRSRARRASGPLPSDPALKRDLDTHSRADARVFAAPSTSSYGET